MKKLLSIFLPILFVSSAHATCYVPGFWHAVCAAGGYGDAQLAAYLTTFSRSKKCANKIAKKANNDKKCPRGYKAVVIEAGYR